SERRPKVSQPKAPAGNSPNTDGRAVVLATAREEFGRAIRLRPGSPDAYRDRAEVLWLENRLQQARESALTACMLTDFRGPRSLRLLARICRELNDCDEAATLAQQAAQYDA